MLHIFAAAICLIFLSQAQSAQAQPIDLRGQSLQDLRNRVAWYGASCIMDAQSVPGRDGPETLDRIIAETGVEGRMVRSWAWQRNGEHSVAVDVLTRGQEPPYRDPPEPFMMILRQTQADCQELEASRNRLAAAIERGSLPDQRPPAPPPVLRADLDPLPFDHERWQRLSWVIAHIRPALAEGVAPQDLQALFVAMTGRTDIDIAIYDADQSPEDVARRALSLLTPARVAHPDVTHAELVELARRAQSSIADYRRGRPPMYLYYLEQFRLNTGGFGTHDLFLDPDPAWLAQIGTDSPSPEQIVEEALRRTPECHDVPYLDLTFCAETRWIEVE